MKKAIELAKEAASNNEVPVGAIIVKDHKIIATGYNSREKDQLITSHAELIAINKASKYLKSWRLNDCSLYTTLEPCLMCAGALYQARIKELIFGAFDPKGGAVGSLYKIQEDCRLNHSFTATHGILQEKCAALLSDFFGKKRPTRNQQSSIVKQL